MSDEKPRTMRGSDDDYCATYPADGHFYVGHSVNAEPIGFVDRCQFCGHISSRALRERLDTESTSAALARVTAERDKARDAFALAEELRLKARQAARQNGEWLARALDDKQRLADERDHARSERDALKALLAEMHARTQGGYPEPGCGKHTGNASNRCLRALNHPGPCDDNPPISTSTS